MLISNRSTSFNNKNFPLNYLIFKQYKLILNELIERDNYYFIEKFNI